MKNDKHERNELQRMMEGRAAHMIVAAVTVFLCTLTLFEFVALKMEWNVPALAVLSGDNGLWTREYQREELVMDGMQNKMAMINDESQEKLQDTMQKIVNDSNGGLVCIII